MSLDIALYAYLSGHMLLAPLLAGRVYPELAPTQAALPYVLYTDIGYAGSDHFQGAGALALATYQLDIYGRSHRQVRDIAEAVRLAIDGYQGVSEGVPIRRVILRGRQTGLEDDQAGGQEDFYRATLELDIWYMQAVTVFAY